MAIMEQERVAAATSAGGRRVRRLVAAGSAVVAAVAAWALIEPIGGVDLRAPAQGSSEGFDIGLLAVALTSAAASLVAWGSLAAAERWTRRPKGIWTGVALAAFLLSLSGPALGTGIATESRWLLALLHLVVTVTLIPQLRGTIRR